MKVQVNMHLTPNDFFEYITQSLMVDIFKHTDQFKSAYEIKQGLKYIKTVKRNNGQDLEANVEITAFEKPFRYQSQIQIGTNMNQITYEIEGLDDEHIQVTYTESFDSTKKLHVWNYYLVSFFMTHISKKKMKQMLAAMETHIQNKELL